MTFGAHFVLGLVQFLCQANGVSVATWKSHIWKLCLLFVDDVIVPAMVPWTTKQHVSLQCVRWSSFVTDALTSSQMLTIANRSSPNITPVHKWPCGKCMIGTFVWENARVLSDSSFKSPEEEEPESQRRGRGGGMSHCHELGQVGYNNSLHCSRSQWFARHLFFVCIHIHAISLSQRHLSLYRPVSYISLAHWFLSWP